MTTILINTDKKTYCKKLFVSTLDMEESWRSINNLLHLMRSNSQLKFKTYDIPISVATSITFRFNGCLSGATRALIEKFPNLPDSQVENTRAIINLFFLHLIDDEDIYRKMSLKSKGALPDQVPGFITLSADKPSCAVCTLVHVKIFSMFHE